MPPSPDPGLLGALIDLVLPRVCAGCAVPGAALCPGCRTRVAAEVLGFGGPTHWRPTPTPQGFPSCVVAAAYGGVLAQLVKAHKDGARHDLTDILSTVLAASVAELVPAGPVLLVPAPSRSAALRARGRAPVVELAAEVARRSAGRIQVAAGLRVRAAVRDQAGLDSAGRIANVHGAMSARPRVLARAAGSVVVLVDDVVTSGATLAEATRALHVAGVEVRGAAAICARRRLLHVRRERAMN